MTGAATTLTVTAKRKSSAILQGRYQVHGGARSRSTSCPSLGVVGRLCGSYGRESVGAGWIRVLITKSKASVREPTARTCRGPPTGPTPPGAGPQHCIISGFGEERLLQLRQELVQEL